MDNYFKGTLFLKVQNHQNNTPKLSVQILAAENSVFKAAAVVQW